MAASWGVSDLDRIGFLAFLHIAKYSHQSKINSTIVVTGTHERPASLSEKHEKLGLTLTNYLIGSANK